MATYNDRYQGYLWSDEEREPLKLPLQRFRTRFYRSKELLFHIRTMLPEFADAAQAAFDHLADLMSPWQELTHAPGGGSRLLEVGGFPWI